MKLHKSYSLYSIGITQGNRSLDYKMSHYNNQPYIQYRYGIEKEILKDIPLERYWKAKAKYCGERKCGYNEPSITSKTQDTKEYI